MHSIYKSLKTYCFLIYLLTFSIAFGAIAPSCPEKVLICGVGKNIAPTMTNTIQNIEALGSHFADYAVLIYENNSTDQTKRKLQFWTKLNPHVVLQCEDVPTDKLPRSRTEKIARARNCVLAMARDPKYSDFKYLIMADLDFETLWPIAEILNTLKNPADWDCVSSNGHRFRGDLGEIYYDRYAFRDSSLPFGPELLGEGYWKNLDHTWFSLQGEEWIPAFSAFGGLAIYKTASILNFSYSGTVTEDLKQYYQHIIGTLPRSNPQLQAYLKIIGLNGDADLSLIPIIFQENTPLDRPKDECIITCCEHVALHASLFLQGFGKFYINPKMIMEVK